MLSCTWLLVKSGDDPAGRYVFVLRLLRFNSHFLIIFWLSLSSDPVSFFQLLDKSTSICLLAWQGFYWPLSRCLLWLASHQELSIRLHKTAGLVAR
jgi:hypothetical protein